MNKKLLVVIEILCIICLLFGFSYGIYTFIRA